MSEDLKQKYINEDEVPMGRSKEIVLVHISKTPCWRCLHLCRNPYNKTYYCFRNRLIPEQVEAWFAEKCSDYKEKLKK
jgi:hypothetical protein